MNSLFTSSWAKNVKPNAIALWNHEFKEIVNEGTRGRAAHPAYAKLMGMQSVKNLKGTMTPRYFATKVLKQLEKEHPEEKIEDIIANITDEDITSMMNVAAQMSRKLQMKPELTFNATKAEKSIPTSQRFEKGEGPVDTLQKNISPETHFRYINDVGDNTVYSASHNGLRFRVTVKHGAGESMSLNDLLHAHVISLQIEDPESETTVEGPQTDETRETTLGSHKRDKLVADYPHEGNKGNEDWNEPDPEETGGKNAKRDDEEDEENTNINSQEVEKLLGKIDSRMIDSGLYGTPDSAAVFAALRNGDVATAAEEICYSYTDQNGGEANMEDHIKDVEIALNHMLHKGTSQGVEDEEDAEENITHNMTAEEAKGYINGSEEDNEEPIIKLSPQAQQRAMYNDLMQKRRDMVKHQREHDLGY